MKRKYKHEESILVIEANLFFLAITCWWLYGIFTTFFKGRIPILGWTTEHNIILGILWILVLGQGAPMPAKTFRQLCGCVAIWRRGYTYLPIFLLNFLLQLYFWIIIITAWFPQPLPRPFDNFTGGFLAGVVAVVVMISICMVGNITAVRLLDSFTKKEPR